VPPSDKPHRASSRDALAGSAADLYLIPVRGRKSEVHAIEQGFDLAFAGQNAVTVFSGDPGMGKTRLLQHALQQAKGRGWSTLVVAPDFDSQLSPLGALIDAVTDTDPPLLSADELYTAIRGMSPQYWITRAIGDALEAASSRAGVLVVVDDLQWLDSGSLSVITALLRALDGLPVYWVFATRSGAYGLEHRRFLIHLREFASVIDLASLGVDAVDAMARDVLGAAPGPKVEAAIRKTGGSPLLILELLRGMEEEGLLHPSRGMVDLQQNTVPARYGASVRERIAALDADARRIAQIGSLYGREFPLSGVLDVIGQSAAEAVPAIQQLLDLGFVVDTGSGFAFRHDTIQTAAYDSLSPTVRRAVAREVLQRRLRAGESVSSLASPISAAAEAGDDASIELLFTAARELALADARGAAELTVRGAQLAQGRTHHSTRVVELLPLVLAGGLHDDAVRIRESLTPGLSADERARVSLAFARQLTESDFGKAIAETEAALALGGVSQETTVQLLAVRALNYANSADAVGLRDSLARARQHADDERDVLAVATVDATESVLLFNENRFDEAQRLQTSALEKLERAGRSAALWVPEGLWMAFMVNSRGECADALRLVDDGLRDARTAKHVVAEAYWMMVRSRVLYDLGRLDPAREQAETVLDLAELLHLGDFANATAGVVLHRIALDTGDVELRQTVRPLVQQLADGVSLTRTGRWSLALEAFDLGDIEAAYRHTALARECVSVPVPSMTTPADFSDDVYLAYLSKRMGDDAAVEKVARHAARRAAQNPGNAYVAAVSLSVQAVRDGSFAHVMEAVALMAEVDRPLIRARLLELAGSLAPTDAEAADCYVQGMRLFEELGAAREVSRVLRTLRNRGVRTRAKSVSDGPMGLSSREYQVAERIAAGLTTQQIADDLMVSPHTVVTHIRHIFSKWGVNTRRAAARRFHEESAVSTNPSRLS
jgi:DNA-binding CsgD family transcriptional regulator/tetratricopeptide (TPR) repeat protein